MTNSRLRRVLCVIASALAISLASTADLQAQGKARRSASYSRSHRSTRSVGKSFRAGARRGGKSIRSTRTSRSFASRRSVGSSRSRSTRSSAVRGQRTTRSPVTSRSTSSARRLPSTINRSAASRTTRRRSNDRVSERKYVRREASQHTRRSSAYESSRSTRSTDRRSTATSRTRLDRDRQAIASRTPATSGVREQKARSRDDRSTSRNTTAYDRSGTSAGTFNFGFNRHDEDSRLSAGFHAGAAGVGAYLHRGEHGRHYPRHHYGHHRPRHSIYYYYDDYDYYDYPYAHASHYSIYYHRYPYRYSTIYPYYYSSIVYLDQPTRTVYIDQPVETVYGDTYPDPDSVQTPVSPLEEPLDIGDPNVAEPQAEIPVNNAFLADAELAFNEGRYEDARSFAARAALNEPQNGFAQLTYGLVHFAMGEYVPAARAVRRGLSLVPDVIDRPIDITRQYGSAGDLDRHTAALRSYTDAHAGSADAWFLLGYIHYSSGNPADALVALDKAAALDPADTHAAILRDATARVSTER